MTTKQHRWYLREWSAAFRAHWAGVRGGEVLARPGRPEVHELREQILAICRRMLAVRGGRLDPDTIRHACHVHALGRDIPSMKMTNKQLDRTVAVFRQLAGVNLAAMLTTEAASAEQHRLAQARRARRGDPAATPVPMPDADRTRLLWAIEHADLPPAYVEEICRDRFGTGNWRSLPTPSLHQLRITLACRATARAVGNTKRINMETTL